MTRHITPHPEPIHSLFSEIQGEILDDCGDWDMPVSVVEIVDCAVNDTFGDDGDFEALTNAAGMVCDEAGMERLYAIALSLPNTYRN